MIPNLKLFRTLHSSLFTDQVNDLIMKTAKAIATHLQAKQIGTCFSKPTQYSIRKQKLD
jgi:hypothetical protein